ncbi:MAG: ribbon-helix-helix protein, CopG family [Alphaproteobacteria bacterium]|jgi:RHH-type rel operon transcriptional repressor/antitoxin RelB|nr:ribbon-helix-helix protein, CopG family [Alphaproteobacteria bacterium]
MMTIRLPEEMEQRLSQLAKETHRTKTYYVKRAIEEFLDDQEDYLLALSVMERVEKGKEKTIPFEEILKHKKKNL